MRTSAFIFALSAIVSAAHGAEVMDGSDKEFGGDIAQRVAEYMFDKSFDPYSTEIARLHRSTGNENIICGFLNIKNKNGLYMGFQPFYFDTVNNQIEITKIPGC